MPRETTRKLSDDTARLLVAGAHLAQGSADLARDKAALEALIAKLGAKAPPVFGKLIEQIDKTVSAKPKDQAGELLTLMTSIGQVRMSLAQLAPAPPAGGDAQLARVPAIQAPCNAKDLYTLHDALVTTGPGRMEKIEDAVERGDVADLRLVHAVVQAMGDTYVGDKVSDDVVPKFGLALVGAIRGKLHFPGKKVDGRRLRALVAVEKLDARDVVEQAIREGSPDVRAAALDALADHMAGVAEFEAIVLSILEKERTGDVRRAAVRALAGYGSDGSFEQLMESLDDDRTSREAAEALGKSKHPKVVERLLARLQTAAADAKAKVKKTDKVAAKNKANAERLATLILGALAEHPDERIVDVARGLVDDYGRAAAYAVMRQGNADDHRAIAELLGGADASVFTIAVQAAMKLPADECFERLVKVLRAKDHASKLGAQRVSALRYAEFVPSGDRWVKALVTLSQDAGRPHFTLALLGATKDPRALPALLTVLEEDKAEKKSAATAEVIGALAELGDKRALDPILARLQVLGSSVGWRVRSSIIELADESTVGKVRAIYASLKEPEAYKNWLIRGLLNGLERKFPGH